MIDEYVPIRQIEQCTISDFRISSLTHVHGIHVVQSKHILEYLPRKLTRVEHVGA